MGIDHRSSSGSIFTVVVDVMGFLLVVVYGGPVNFHPHMGVHDGAGLVTFWFW